MFTELDEPVEFGAVGKSITFACEIESFEL